MKWNHAFWGGVWALVVAQVLSAQVSLPRWSVGAPPPLHPTVVFATYKGRDLPVMAVSGEVPQVEVDGKLKRLSSKATFQPRRGRHYAPGELSLRNMRGSSQKTNLILMFNDGGRIDNGTIAARSDFSATVVSTESHKNCYVAIVFFDQGYLDGTVSSHGATVQFEKIPDLEAGKETQINLTFGYVDTTRARLGFFPLFFTEGLEIRSDQCGLIASFFRRMENSRHDVIVRQFLEKNPDKTVPVQAYLQIPPLFVEPEILNDAPANVDVSFMVNEEGRMDSLQFETRTPTEVRNVLSRTLNAWLFLPRLKEGRPARTMVRLPLRIKNDGDVVAAEETLAN